MGSLTCLLVDFVGFVGLVSVSGPRPIGARVLSRSILERVG